MRASLLLRPVLHRVLTEPPSLHAADLDRLDRLLQERAVAATNAFVDEMQRRLSSKNVALRRMNDELQQHRAALTREVEETTHALSAARTLNSKVIESLASGVVVIAGGSAEVIVYSPRAEEILELPAEEVLGQPVEAVGARIAGLEARSMVDAVLLTGELPLTKRRLQLPSGRSRWVYVSARRLVGDDGSHEGTVVIVDDVTERELLLDSFSRYVSRYVVHRLLARGSVELD
jgi:PAS domain S-box-containing protein